MHCLSKKNDFTRWILNKDIQLFDIETDKYNASLIEPQVLIQNDVKYCIQLNPDLTSHIDGYKLLGSVTSDSTFERLKWHTDIHI